MATPAPELDEEPAMAPAAKPAPSPAPSPKEESQSCASEPVTHILDPKEIHHIRDLFTAFDANANGKICREEVIKVFPKRDGETNKPLIVDTPHGKIVFDADGDEWINWDEWLAYFAGVKHDRLKGDPSAWKKFMAWIELNVPMSPRQIYHMSEIFKMYDANKDEFLEAEEVERMKSSEPRAKKKFEANENKISNFFEPDNPNLLSLKGLLRWCAERRNVRGFWDVENLINDLWGYKVAALDQAELEALERVFKKLAHEVVIQSPAPDTAPDGAPAEAGSTAAGPPKTMFSVSLLLLGLPDDTATDSESGGRMLGDYTKAQLLQRACHIKLTEGQAVLGGHIARWDLIQARPCTQGKGKRCCGPDAGCMIQ
eukprot:TRINITY_DN17165_c0_g1_i3.p1 TRINITY_DN17165_c0_g1~~TRINITY_DN17165_c0_g1_i3.p1  ORF type:complete len:371 (-),score=93.07 TRINITY_DN17165_c0_g1_i3:287-1399(-)